MCAHKKSSILFVVYFLLQPLTLVRAMEEVEKPTFDEQGLERTAASYGYKYANLEQLKKLCAYFNTHGMAYKIVVPRFVGISSDTIQSFLRHKGFDIADTWKTLFKTYLNNKQEAIKSKGYPDAFLGECKKLAEQIQVAFEEATEQETTLSSLFKIEGLDELINEVADHEEKCMVRSTGREDSKYLTNAGGNDSKANVSPNAKNILQAMGTVVASYFGERSLKQRLDAGDGSLFSEEKPFTPVLIQHMIGESKKEIPSCGVMFTEDPEGGISRFISQGEKFQTSGFTLIQVAKGHNEGVVNSLVSVDSFYVDDAGTIYPIIRIKTYRMVPTHEGRLTMKKNPENLINKPALDKATVHTLKSFAQALEDFYQWPMDVEFVIKNNIISVVQARPITHHQHVAAPSYLVETEKMVSEDKVPGISIGIAGGAVRFITNPAHVIIKENIRQALIAYQNKTQTPHPAEVQAIVVGTMAPSTSHEATTFRAANKPVIYIPHWQKIEAWRKEKAQLIISPQQGLIVKGDKESINVNLGWCDYPAPPYVSLHDAFNPLPKLPSMSDKLIKGLENRWKSVKSFDAALIKINQEIKNQDGIAQLKHLFQAIKFDTRPRAAAAVIILLKKWLFWMAERSKQFTLDKAEQHYVANLADYAVAYALSTLGVLHYEPNDEKNFTKRLFPIRFLESMCWQHLQPDIIDNISITSFVLSWLGEEGKIVKQAPKLGFMMRKFGLVKKCAMSAELGDSWIRFLQELNNTHNESLKKEFFTIFLKLGTLDIIPLWLNTSFAQQAHVIKKHVPLDVETLCTTLNDEYISQAGFMNELIKINNALKTFKIDSFGDHKNFVLAWKSFQKNLVSFFVNKAFVTSFLGTNQLGKIAAINSMNKFVEAFDVSIKTLTGNPEYPLKKKLKRFRSMLLSYSELLECWKDLLHNSKLKHSISSQVLDVVKKVLARQFTTQHDLQAREKFMLGEELTPETGEEAFTVIHQNLLSCLIELSSAIGSGEHIPVPPLLATVRDACLSLNTEHTRKPVYPQFVGIISEGNSITFKYNLPLGMHSMQYSLCYNNTEHTVLLDVGMSGPADWGRWGGPGRAAYALQESRILKIFNCLSMDTGIRFKIIIDQHTDIPMMVDFIQMLISLTYSHNFGRRVSYDKMLPHKNFNAVHFAWTLLQSTDKEAYLDGILLFKTLFDHDRGFEECMRIIEHNSALENKSVQASITTLLTLMVHDIVKFKNAPVEDLLTKAIDRASSVTSTESNTLLETLINHVNVLQKANIDLTMFFEKAINVAEKNENIDLFVALINQAKTLKNAYSFWTKAIELAQAKKSLVIFVALVNQTETLKNAAINLSDFFTNALTIAHESFTQATVLKTYSKEKQKQAMRLFVALINQTEALTTSNINLKEFFKTTVTIAHKGNLHDHGYLIIELFGALIKQSVALQNADINLEDLFNTVCKNATEACFDLRYNKDDVNALASVNALFNEMLKKSSLFDAVRADLTKFISWPFYTHLPQCALAMYNKFCQELPITVWKKINENTLKKFVAYARACITENTKLGNSDDATLLSRNLEKLLENLK